MIVFKYVLVAVGAVYGLALVVGGLVALITWAAQTDLLWEAYTQLRQEVSHDDTNSLGLKQRIAQLEKELDTLHSLQGYDLDAVFASIGKLSKRVDALEVPNASKRK